MEKKNLKHVAIILFGLIPLLALGTVSTINSNATTLDSTQLSICEDSYEENDSSAAAYTVSRSTTYIWNLEQEDDDWFKMYLYAGESLDVDIYFTHSYGDTDLQIYNPSLGLIDGSYSVDDDESVSAPSVSTTGYYYIKVYNGPSTGYYDIYFTLTEYITVTTPTSATSWQAGTSHYIYWSSSGAISLVDIYLYDGGSYYSTIATGESNDGSYYWSIPSSVPLGYNYQIKIEDYYDSSIYDYSAAYFTITSSSSAYITISTPSSSSSWQRGTSHYIYWSSYGCSDYVTIELYKDGYYYSTITSSTSNDGSYYWSISSSQTTSDYYQIKIEDYYDYNIYDHSAAYFSITSACSITVSTPSSSTFWQRGSSHYIYWTSSGCSSYVTIELYKDGYYYSTIASSTSNDGSYYWSIPSSLPVGSLYEVKIEDYYTSSYYDYSSYFSITGVSIPGFTWGFVFLGIIMLLSMIKILLRKKRNSHLFSP